MVNATAVLPNLPSKNWLRGTAPTTRFSLRGNAAAQQLAGQALGLTLPVEACRAHSAGERAALWLGPDEHLVIAPLAEGEALRAQLAAALAATPHSLVDVSHRQIGLELYGPHASWLLNAGCPLDLGLAAFPIGMCTRSVFMKTELLLWRKDADVFHVEIWRSFTDYFTGLLSEVARELPG
jgi:sarcosine oxidase subunit gamma